MMADPWVIFAAQIPTSTKTMSPTSKYFTITNLVYWRYKITITGTPYRNYNNKHINLCLSKGSWNKSPLKLERGTKRQWRPTRRRLPRKKKRKEQIKQLGQAGPVPPLTCLLALLFLPSFLSIAIFFFIRFLEMLGIYCIQYEALVLSFIFFPTNFCLLSLILNYYIPPHASLSPSPKTQH